MRRFLLVAAAAAIAMVGLSANQCTGEQKEATPPAETPAPSTPPAETPAPAPETPPAQ